MKTITIDIAQLSTADFPLFHATVRETGDAIPRADRLDAEGDPRLAAWYPGISDFIAYREDVTSDPLFVPGINDPTRIVFRNRDIEVIIHDVAVRPAVGESDLTVEEINEIILAILSKVIQPGSLPEQALLEYIERLVDQDRNGIIHRVVHLYTDGNRPMRRYIGQRLPLILSRKYRPILEAGGTADFQFWLGERAQKDLKERLVLNVGNSLLSGIIDELVTAFVDRPRRGSGRAQGGVSRYRLRPPAGHSAGVPTRYRSPSIVTSSERRSTPDGPRATTGAEPSGSPTIATVTVSSQG